MHPRTIGCRFTVPVRSFTGAQSRRKRTARRLGVYRLRPRVLSTKNAHFVGQNRYSRGQHKNSGRLPEKQCLNSYCAALRPYSCVVLTPRSRDGITTGGFQPPSIRPLKPVRMPSLTAFVPTGIVPALQAVCRQRLGLSGCGKTPSIRGAGDGELGPNTVTQHISSETGRLY